MRGVLIGSLSILFSFEISASQFRASSGGPSTGRASCSCGTCPFIRQARPSVDVDRSYHVSMAYPATVRTDIGSVLCFVSGTTGRTLRRVSSQRGTSFRCPFLTAPPRTVLATFIAHGSPASHIHELDMCCLFGYSFIKPSLDLVRLIGRPYVISW